MNLAGVGGLTITAGGNGTAAMTFNGTPANVNAALNGMIYTPAANYNGTAELLQITTSDMGNTGSGGAKTGTDSVAITVTAVNDAPVCTDTTPSTTQDIAIDIVPSCTDVDLDALTFGLMSAPTNGTSLAGLTTLHYAPAAGYVGLDSFSFLCNGRHHLQQHGHCDNDGHTCQPCSCYLRRSRSVGGEHIGRRRAEYIQPDAPCH